MNALRAMALAGGLSVPSARFRIRQYIPALQTYDILVDEPLSRTGKYPPRAVLARPFWAAAAVLEKACQVINTRGYDVVLLQRELISKLVTFERRIRVPVVLDVDDAIYLFRKGYVARQLANIAAVVVCGNAELATHFSRWNTSIRVIPTAVDTDAYRPREEVQAAAPFPPVTIGWIGTSSNLHELRAIEPALVHVLERIPEVRLRVVSDCRPTFSTLSAARVEYVPWRAANEVTDIQGMDIGIMPLRDSAWARGKCSFKMLQYMACGLPVVVSPVGMNVEVARLGNCALEAISCEDWKEALIALARDAALRWEMGRAGRAVVERHFSVAVLAPRLAEAIRSAL